MSAEVEIELGVLMGTPQAEHRPMARSERRRQGAGHMETPITIMIEQTVTGRGGRKIRLCVSGA